MSYTKADLDRGHQIAHSQNWVGNGGALRENIAIAIANALAEGRISNWPSLVKPQININGTSRDELLRQQMDVLRAYRALSEALADAAPHGRDYQLRPQEYAPARAAWMERSMTIFAMRKEIEKHAEEIQRDQK
jgi:hypothetical protein